MYIALQSRWVLRIWNAVKKLSGVKIVIGEITYLRYGRSTGAPTLPPALSIMCAYITVRHSIEKCIFCSKQQFKMFIRQLSGALEAGGAGGPNMRKYI